MSSTEYNPSHFSGKTKELFASGRRPGRCRAPPSAGCEPRAPHAVPPAPPTRSQPLLHVLPVAFDTGSPTSPLGSPRRGAAAPATAPKSHGTHARPRAPLPFLGQGSLGNVARFARGTPSPKPHTETKGVWGGPQKRWSQKGKEGGVGGSRPPPPCSGHFQPKPRGGISHPGSVRWSSPIPCQPWVRKLVPTSSNARQ